MAVRPRLLDVGDIKTAIWRYARGISLDGQERRFWTYCSGWIGLRSDSITCAIRHCCAGKAWLALARSNRGIWRRIQFSRAPSPSECRAHYGPTVGGERYANHSTSRGIGDAGDQLPGQSPMDHGLNSRLCLIVPALLHRLVRHTLGPR
jgi:hypothetical protein